MTDRVKELMARLDEKCKAMNPKVDAVIEAIKDYEKIDEELELQEFTSEEKRQLGEACKNSAIFKETEEKFDTLRDLM